MNRASSIPSPVRIIRFGEFEVDLQSGELRKHGLRIKLQEQPFRVLTLLLERAGEVVTREELRQKLWSTDTFVDFEHSLNTSIKKLRQALGDSAYNPRFVETLARRGYRFIPPVEKVGERFSNSNLATGQVAEVPELEGHHTKRQLTWAGGLVACLSALSLAVWLWNSSRTSDDLPMTAIPLTTYPGHEHSPSFSPDGNQVAFSWNGPGQDNFDIYIKLIGADDQPLPLTTDPAEDYGPVWSPDGRSIVFLRALSERRAAVVLVSPIGGREKKLAEVYQAWLGWGPALAWSPAGDSLILVDKEDDSEPYGLFVLSLESRARRRLTSPSRLMRGDFGPAFSPDGHNLAFVRALDFGSAELCLLPGGERLRVEGEPKSLTLRRPRINSFSWTPDGRHIVFSDGVPSGATGGLGHLWRIPATKSGEARRLPVGEAVMGLNVSGKRQRLVYSREVADINVWRVAISGSHATTAIPKRFIDSTQADTNPQISPDGKRIAFSSSRSGSFEIWTCNSSGSDPVPLTFFGRGQSASPRWSPDSRSVTFDSNIDGQWEVYVVEADGGKVRRLTSHPAEDANPSWSRDGKSIYFNSNRSGRRQVWKIPVSGGEALPVTKNGGFVPLESHDGKFVYYMKADDDRRICKIPSGGGDETQVLGAIFRRDYDVAKDGIYFISEPDNPIDRSLYPWSRSQSIRFLDFATGVIKTIVSIENPWGQYISVSPDGGWILYPQLDQHGSDLILVENFR